MSFAGGFKVDGNHAQPNWDALLNTGGDEAAKRQAEKLLAEKQFADDRSFADATAVLEKSLAHLRLLRKHRSHSKGPHAE